MEARHVLDGRYGWNTEAVLRKKRVKEWDGYGASYCIKWGK